MTDNNAGRILDRRGFFKEVGVLGGAAVLAFAVPSLLVGCSGGDTAANTDGTASGDNQFPLGSVQIQALGGGLCGTPSYIAKDNGFWADEGVDVTLVSGTFQQNTAGLASGQFPVANGDFQFFPAINEGLNVKVIGGMHQGCIKLLVPGDSSIQTVADLKGKIIGVDEVGGTPWAITSVALANSDINPSADAHEVTFAPYDLTTLESVASSGEVDAIAAWDPFGTQAENDGFRVLVDIATDPLFAGRYCCFLYAAGDTLQNNPDLIKALLKGWDSAIEWVSVNPEEAARVVTDSSEHEAYVASDDLDLLVTLLKSYNYASEHTMTTAEEPYNDAVYFATQLKKTGYLPADLDPVAFAENAVYSDIPGLQS